MKAVRLRQPASLEHLELVTLDDPGRPGSGEILVRLRASSFNYHNYVVVTGCIKTPDGRIPMSDGAGELLAVGDKLAFKFGEPVVSTIFPGWLDGAPIEGGFVPGEGADGYARELVIAPASAFVRVPAGYNHAEAATLTCAGLTAWRALVVEGRLKAGETVLVQGTGGVSIFAVRFAKAMGATVIATSSSDEKLERLQTLGADYGINYRSQPKWGSAARELTGGRGVGYAAQDATTPLAPFRFERRALRPDDVQIDILYCGVCHSDLHQSRNDWNNSSYPVVPGHEIVGRVTAVGEQVTRFAVGDVAAIGCIVDSCKVCEQCAKGHEQYCYEGATQTYNGRDRHTRETTLGGYSGHIVAREDFMLKVPAGLDLERVAPLLCAGITTWSPLRHWKVGPGTRVGVVGLGGLGHMGVKLAVGLGANVTVITTSASKREDARALGAHAVLLSSSKDDMKAAFRSLDFILDTVPVAHDCSAYLRLLRPEGAHVIVGAIDMLPQMHSGLLIGGRKILTGSGIGGIAETQELLNFCSENNILPDCETIAIQDINTAYERMERNDVKYRFVIDMASLDKEKAKAA